MIAHLIAKTFAIQLSLFQTVILYVVAHLFAKTFARMVAHLFA